MRSHTALHGWSCGRKGWPVRLRIATVPPMSPPGSQHWLSQATHDLDPAITAFITACAEKERTVLASATEAPEGDAEGGA